MADTQQQVPEVVQQPKKKIIKIKRKSVEANAVTEEKVDASSEESTAETAKESQTDNEEKEQVSLIPSSRVKNYLSKEKLNKEYDTLIEKIKNSTESIDLSTILSEESQSKIGSVIKQKEEKGEEIVLNTIAVEFLSKQKYKFSNQSFKVLSVFLDMMIEDLTLNVMEEIKKNKKSIINTKYVVTANTTSSLYPIYSKLPTFVNLKSESESDSNEDQCEESSDEQVEETQHSINFEFYIRKICNKLKKSNEEFVSLKVSNNYQKFCSNLILEFLDIIAPVTTILLEVMTTKTISVLVFETALKLQLYNNPNMHEIMTEVKSRMSN